MRFIASYTDDFGATDEIRFNYELIGNEKIDAVGVGQAFAQRLADAIADANDERLPLDHFDVSTCTHIGGYTWAFIVHCPGWTGVGFIRKI